MSKRSSYRRLQSFKVVHKRTNAWRRRLKFLIEDASLVNGIDRCLFSDMLRVATYKNFQCVYSSNV